MLVGAIENYFEFSNAVESYFLVIIFKEPNNNEVHVISLPQIQKLEAFFVK